MISVKELVPMLVGAKNIELDYGGSFHVLEPNDDFTMDAFGKYVVRYINITESGVVSLMLATKPVIKEDGGLNE